MPGQIRQLDPNWASCEYSSYALFDPPIALKGVPNFLTSSSAAAEPTPTSVDPGVSATPGQSSNDDSPPATSKPQPQRPTSTRVPVEPQESDSSTPQNPSPSFPQDPLPSAPQDPPLSTPQAPPPSDPQAPPSSDPQDLPPNNPQNPWISPSNSDSPGSPLPSNTPGPLHHDPQDVVTGQHLATNPAANLAANPTLPVITIGPTCHFCGPNRWCHCPPRHNLDQRGRAYNHLILDFLHRYRRSHHYLPRNEYRDTFRQ
jgi:hypothetical protein